MPHPHRTTFLIGTLKSPPVRAIRKSVPDFALIKNLIAKIRISISNPNTPHRSPSPKTKATVRVQGEVNVQFPR
jgi:hypothetical protein